MNTVSTPISTAIKIAGSQGKLAKIIGVHQTAISHFFLGRKRPSPEVAMKLQSAVNNQYKWYEFIGIEQGATHMETQPNGSTDAAGDSLAADTRHGAPVPAQIEHGGVEHGVNPTNAGQ